MGYKGGENEGRLKNRGDGGDRNHLEGTDMHHAMFKSNWDFNGWKTKIWGMGDIGDMLGYVLACSLQNYIQIGPKLAEIKVISS